jgi:hypothetical protein
MNTITNAALVWKREATEYERWTRWLTRVSAVLLILFLATAAYAFSVHSQYSKLCSNLASRTEALASPSASKSIGALVQGYCR